MTELVNAISVLVRVLARCQNVTQDCGYSYELSEILTYHLGKFINLRNAFSGWREFLHKLLGDRIELI